MALNVRLALGICLTSIGGSCWVGERGARPIGELPSPLAAPALASDASPGEPAPAPDRPAMRDDVRSLAGRFERPSPVQARPRGGPAAAVLVASTSFGGAQLEGPHPLSESLPPLRNDSSAGQRVWLPPLADAGNLASAAASPEPAVAARAPADGGRPATPYAGSTRGAVTQPPVQPGTDVVAAPTAESSRGSNSPNGAARSATALVAALPPTVESSPADKAKESGTALSAPPTRDYVVQRGDSLTTIARKTLGRSEPADIRALIAANRALSRNPNHIEIGQKLVIPAPVVANVVQSPPASERSAVARVSAKPGTDRSSIDAQQLAVARKLAATNGMDDARPSSSESGRRTAQSPDAGRDAALASNLPSSPKGAKAPATATSKTSKQQVARADGAQTASSRGKSERRNQPGKPAAAVRSAGSTREAGSGAKPVDGAAGFRWYTVQKDDSLAKIARRQLKNERRWQEIQKLNRLESGDHIEAGRRIKLPATLDDET